MTQAQKNKALLILEDKKDLTLYRRLYQRMERGSFLSLVAIRQYLYINKDYATVGITKIIFLKRIMKRKIKLRRPIQLPDLYRKVSSDNGD